METAEFATHMKGVAGDGEPVRCVKTIADMPKWEKSQAYYDLMGFINAVSTAIQGKRISDDVYISPVMQTLLEIFNKLNQFIDDIPPLEQPQRFGNKAYRSWSRKMNHDIFTMLKRSLALPPENCHIVTELGFYLSESFGNAIRIDYGTGHELSFVFFMCALFKADLLEEADIDACILRLFNTYLLLVRRLQTTYRMEPAGSQGVWALDDYQFLPFVWGSAQLSYRSPFNPEKFLDPDIIEKYKDDYMFISCIDYISKVKTGHFAEHSNQLWGISAVPSWSKINSGLVKMFNVELLSKFPIIQHVYFGELMSFDPVRPGIAIHPARLGSGPQTSQKVPATASGVVGLPKPDSVAMPPPASPSMSSASSVISDN